MEKFITVARLLLGAIFTIFGLNYFFHYMPELPVSDRGAAYLMALFETGYIFPIIKIIEIVAGLLLLSGYFVPLSLTMLTPVSLNIFLYHSFLDSNGLVLAIAIFAVNLLLLWSYREYFKGLFTLRAHPGTIEFDPRPLTDDMAVAKRM